MHPSHAHSSDRPLLYQNKPKCRKTATSPQRERKDEHLQNRVGGDVLSDSRMIRCGCSHWPGHMELARVPLFTSLFRSQGPTICLTFLLLPCFCAAEPVRQDVEQHAKLSRTSRTRASSGPWTLQKHSHTPHDQPKPRCDWTPMSSVCMSAVAVQSTTPLSHGDEDKMPPSRPSPDGDSGRRWPGTIHVSLRGVPLHIQSISTPRILTLSYIRSAGPLPF